MVVNQKGDNTRDETRWGPSMGTVGGACTFRKANLISFWQMVDLLISFPGMIGLDILLLVYICSLASWKTFFYIVQVGCRVNGQYAVRARSTPRLLMRRVHELPGELADAAAVRLQGWRSTYIEPRSCHPCE